MKYRTQAGVEVELSEEDLRKLRKTEEGKHTPEALFEKACRNIAHIADKKEDDVHDEKSIRRHSGRSSVSAVLPRSAMRFSKPPKPPRVTSK